MLANNSSGTEKNGSVSPGNNNTEPELLRAIPIDENEYSEERRDCIPQAELYTNDRRNNEDTANQATSQNNGQTKGDISTQGGSNFTVINVNPLPVYTGGAGNSATKPPPNSHFFDVSSTPYQPSAVIQRNANVDPASTRKWFFSVFDIFYNYTHVLNTPQNFPDPTERRIIFYYDKDGGSDTKVGLRLDAFLCFFCLSSNHFNTVYRRAGAGGDMGGMFIPLAGSLCCADLCCLCSSFHCCFATPLHTFIIRQEIRRRYNIKENIFTPRKLLSNADANGMNYYTVHAAVQSQPDSDGTTVVVSTDDRFGNVKDMAVDLCISFFCLPCVLYQHHKELTAYGCWPGQCVFSRDDGPHTVLDMT